MEQYRYLILTVCIVLPVIAAFGVTALRRCRSFERRHHIISYGDMTATTMYSLEADETEKTFKDYVCDNYC